MKLLKKVRPLEVKRAFVIADRIKLSRKKGKKYLPNLDRVDFFKKVAEAKRVARMLSEKQLDTIIGGKYQKREDAYSNYEWYFAKASIKELGVWRRAGGLPPQWTCCSLEETARYVQKGLARESNRIRARSKRAIPRIMEFADDIVKEKYLSPVVFMNSTGTCGRRWCKTKVEGDIDDGSMRSIALAISGRKILTIYFGKPK